jgi:hypothetical protein
VHHKTAEKHVTTTYVKEIEKTTNDFIVKEVVLEVLIKADNIS